jgi:aspartokinase-like uncharacterized kinase
MNVVKLGGSLLHDPLLPAWLGRIAAQVGGQTVIVPGGGPFADAARAVQKEWRVNDVCAHNMAVLGMAQSAHLLHGLEPRLALADSEAGLRACLDEGRAAIWLPLSLQRTEPDALTSWDVTSDSLAAWLALRLGARSVVLVKSCPVPPQAGPETLAAAGIVDRAFPGYAAQCARAGITCAVVTRTELERLME